jgi:outer membrane protein insertion porin family
VTVDGVSRTLSASYRNYKQYTSSSSQFDTSTGALSIDYGWPLSEFQSVRVGLSAQQSDLFTDPNQSAEQSVVWVQNNGNPYTRNARVGVPPITFEYYGTKFNTFLLSAGWGYDSRNRAIFADRGARHWINLSYTVPGSDVEFFTASYDYLQFVPLGRWFTLMNNFGVGYGQALGSTTSIPPFRNYFAGGAESVRGFRASTLGPKDTFGNPYGGNSKLTNQLELLLPMPEKFRNSARFSAFFDVGNVFSNENVKFYGKDNVTPVDYTFGFDKLRYSTGVAVQWLAPLGVFRFSYAVPLNARKSNGIEYADETENFQFSIGQAF